jgi:hypothetical protein
MPATQPVLRPPSVPDLGAASGGCAIGWADAQYERTGNDLSIPGFYLDVPGNASF